MAPSARNWLVAATGEALSGLRQVTRELHVVADYTSRPDGGVDVFAVRGKQAWSELSKLVARLVRDRNLDPQSRELWLSLVSRSPDYAAVFGDLPPSSLQLAYGPGLQGGECAYLYNPLLSSQRLDLSARPDSTLGRALREPQMDATHSSGARRARLMSAVRERDNVFRTTLLYNAAPYRCEMGCGRPLGPENVEVHHDPTLSVLARQAYGPDPPATAFQLCPNHHLLSPTPE